MSQHCEGFREEVTFGKIGFASGEQERSSSTGDAKVWGAQGWKAWHTFGKPGTVW